MIRGRSLAAGLLVALLGATAGAAEKEDLQALRQRIEQLKREVAQTEGSRSEASDQLRDAERAISDANRRMRDLTQRQATVRSRIQALEGEAKGVEAEIAARRTEVARWLRARYMAGDQAALRVLLSGDDPHQLARDLEYLGNLSRAQSEVVRAMGQRADQLRTLAAEARDKGAELAALEEEHRTERQRLEAERRARQSLLDKLSGNLRAQRREIETLERDERRMTELVERIARMIRERAEKERERRRDAQKSDISRKEKIPEAVEGAGVFSFDKGRARLPVKGEITGRFGAPRTEGGPSWKGIFIRSAPGQEVRAAAAGRVVFADWMRGFGNLLILDHGQGYLSIYGNNESLLRQPGDGVRSGEAIATVGSSGGVEESGLYFEVRHQGRPIDPMGWLGR